jgi:hypothetical protein
MGALWNESQTKFDLAALQAAVDKEAASVRCSSSSTFAHHLVTLPENARSDRLRGGIYSLILARLGAQVTLLDFSRDTLVSAEHNLRALTWMASCCRPCL